MASLSTALNADFKESPYFYCRPFILALNERLRTTLPDIDWQARKTHEIVDYEPQGLLSLSWVTSDAQWQAIVVAQARAVPRRARGLDTAMELVDLWPVGGDARVEAVAKADHKHQSVMTEKLPDAKKAIMDLALAECPDPFVTAFRQSPIVDQTMFRLISEITRQFFDVPPDQKDMILAELREPWSSNTPPRVYVQRLLSMRDALSPVEQAAFPDVVLNRMLIVSFRFVCL